MATGDITEKEGRKWGYGRIEPITKFTLEIVVKDATSEKEENLGVNMMITDLYMEFPNIGWDGAVDASYAQLDIFSERDNVIYTSGNLDASENTETLADASGARYPIHLDAPRALAGDTTAKITTDSDVSGNTTFRIEFFGV